jgi:DNA-directed RNA polymerase subunit L
MNVMTNTNGVKFYLGKEQISHIYTIPLLIIQLQPGQEFICTMIASLNIAMYNAIYRPCSLCCYDEVDENNYNFLVMSKRQISEKDLILRACKIIINKVINAEQIFISNIKKYNEKNSDIDNTSMEHLQNGTIVIEGEQHTLGNLLSKYLQDHSDITFAGYKVGHPNVNQVDIKYICKTNVLNVIKDVSILVQNIFENISEKVNKMPDMAYRYI